MFSNMGGKIKALAKVVCWVGIIASVITGFSMCGYRGTAVTGIIVMIVGSLSAWIGSFVLCGFGEMVEATMETRDILRRTGSRTFTNASTDTWKCPHCGQENTTVSSQCKGCGQYRT